MSIEEVKEFAEEQILWNEQLMKLYNDGWHGDMFMEAYGRKQALEEIIKAIKGELQ